MRFITPGEYRVRSWAPASGGGGGRLLSYSIIHVPLIYDLILILSFIGVPTLCFPKHYLVFYFKKCLCPKNVQKSIIEFGTSVLSLRNCEYSIALFSANTFGRCMYSTQCTVHSVQYTLYSTHCTVHSVQYTVYSTQCIVHIVQYTWYEYSTHCTVNNIPCPLWLTVIP